MFRFAFNSSWYLMRQNPITEILCNSVVTWTTGWKMFNELQINVRVWWVFDRNSCWLNLDSDIIIRKGIKVEMR